MRLIASHVEPEQWADVMGAIVATNGLATFVSPQIEHGRQVLTASEACYARLDVRAIAAAALALADMSTKRAGCRHTRDRHGHRR